MDHKPFVIVFDGNISSGKTTLVSTVQTELTKLGYSVGVVDEPVEEWAEHDTLDTYYKDTKRWAYMFQTVAFQTRVRRCIEVFEQESRKDIYLLERSCFTDNLFMDMLYDKGDVTDMEMHWYKKWSSFWNRLMPFKPSCFVYLMTDVDECFRRKNERKRVGEDDIPRELLVSLEEKHNKFLLNGDIDIGDGETAFVEIINTNVDYRNKPVEKKLIVDQFVKMIEA